jgi:hypothetical protein
MPRYGMASPMAKAKGHDTKGEKPRGGPARRVGDMLGAAGGPAFRRFGFVQSSIVSRWREIVGERYAQMTSPESIRFPPGKKQDGVLTIAMSGAVAPMIQHVTPEIIERVNRFFGYPAVAKVAIRQGSVLRAEPARAPRAEPVPMPAELGDSLRGIADPELKAVLESLAGSIASNAAAPVLMGKVR